MATPIDNKALLNQFLDNDSGNNTTKTPAPDLPKDNSFEKIGGNTDRNTNHKKKSLRFSITIATPLAISIRQYVTQETINHLMNDKSYSMSQFFSDAAVHYMKVKKG